MPDTLGALRLGLIVALLTAPLPTLAAEGKPVVYQMMTRLFANQQTANVSWGTAEQNGVGKFNDIDHRALKALAELGTSHVWYTGVPHHALVRDHTRFGISNDDPDVVKGRAGSPYAVKDYYSVNPDLATDPANGLDEFRALVSRTHEHGMKVIIDIVPNHVARRYESLGKPAGVRNFGADDDTTVEFHRDNNFYYVPGQDFKVPVPAPGYRPLGGEPHPLADGQFAESPARWTGNGARLAQPGFDDWFETVKINHGVRPDGSYAFDRLPEGIAPRDAAAHFEYWRTRDVPDSWRKYRQIVRFWLAQGVDGFRYDMAELVPVEFWSYLNSAIKQVNPDAFLLAEVYNPDLYRAYIRLGLMDFLYDKVGLYDTLKPIMQGGGSTDEIDRDLQALVDIDGHMLHFLENHDELRIASPQFAGDPRRGLPAMVVSALLGRGPTLVYFGQTVGEPGAGEPGFGSAGRTTIFDYWGVPEHQRWVAGGRYDGAALSDPQKALHASYATLLNLSANEPALRGEVMSLHPHNREQSLRYDDRLYSFARWHNGHRLLVISNFSADRDYDLSLKLPSALISSWQLKRGRYPLTDLLGGQLPSHLTVTDGGAAVDLALKPLQSLVLKLPILPTGGQ